MDDRQIVALYLARKESAIAESRWKYGALLEKIAWNILSDRQDSEECVNDTYLKAWASIPPQKPDSLAAYLGRIVRNLSINRWNSIHAQKRGAGGTLLLSELADCVPSGISVEKETETSQLTEIIDRWLDTLSRDDRVLFLRRYWYGDSVQLLAEKCGTTPSGMAGRLYRLRRKLKLVLEKEEISL